MRRAEENDETVNAQIVAMKEQLRDLTRENEKLVQRCSLLEHDLLNLKKERMALIEQNLKLVTDRMELERELKRRDGEDSA